MDYSQFFRMIPEVSLMAILLIVFFVDMFTAGSKDRKWFNPLVCVLMLVQVGISFMQKDGIEAFGGMYVTSAAANVMKTILAAGTMIVLIQSRLWMSREDTSFKEGEFYFLTISTLLGMNMMVSSGHFILFFIALEMASVPMACLVAIDKYRHNSAEAAAKFVLMATFSSGVMLYGISFLYGSTGTLYFTDMSGLITKNLTLSIMGLVFFFSGLGFKISLVPFHYWTADTYQGAPTTVTGYLSVISKGAAAFTLMTIIVKVFMPIAEYWHYLLYAVIVLSITIANLMAIRQKDLKRFMAFSSISQAGYIMLAVIGANQFGFAALTFYVMIYIVANLGVFTVISVVEEKNNGVTDMASYNGFYSTNPKLAFLMTLSLFSLAGIPPFAGMFSKFFVFVAAVQGGSMLSYAIVFIALINTVISLYYYLLIVKAMYINKSENPLPTFQSDCNTRLALAICTAGVLLLGIGSFFFDWIYTAGAL